MFTTEAHIRHTVVEALKAKRRTDKGEVDMPRVQHELADPRYETWIQQRIADARTRGRLLTAQQFQDLAASRSFAVGDKARYIGPRVLETSPATGRGILREPGQLGTITEVERRSGRFLFVFTPDVDHETRALSEQLDVEVLSRKTDQWQQFERIP